MSKKASAKFSEVRIIGGSCRSRKIRFPEIEGLRPTPNRIRETLFNWLAPYIQGASCLDLFAGSGALGFEAMSRGAKYALMLDCSKDVVAALNQNKQQLGFKLMDIQQATFPYPFDIVESHLFNIVFLDPPFHQGLVPLSLNWLRQSKCLVDMGLVYVESEKKDDSLLTQDEFKIIKNKVASNVRYSLLRYSTFA